MVCNLTCSCFFQQQIELCVRYACDVGNIRVLKYVLLQKMMALLCTVFYFVFTILDQSQKITAMEGHVLRCAKRVFEIQDFKYYAPGDRLRNIFSRHKGKLIKSIENDKNQ